MRIGLLNIVMLNIVLAFAACGQTTLQLREIEADWKDCSNLPIYEASKCDLQNSQTCEKLRKGEAVARLKGEERIGETNTVRYTYEMCITPQGDPDTRLKCFDWYEDKDEPTFWTTFKDRALYVAGGVVAGLAIGVKVAAPFLPFLPLL